MNKNVKRLIKYTGILAGTIIVLAFGLYLIFIFPSTVSCPAFNEGYYDWLPYTEKQDIVFTDGKSDRVFTVSTFEIHHTTSYNANTKCGCCEDQVRIVMTSAEETVEVIYDNYDNPDTCLGEMMRVNFKNGYAEAQNLGISPSDEKFNVENKIFFKKGKGMTKFIVRGKTWSLKSSGTTGKKQSVGNGTGC